MKEISGPEHTAATEVVQPNPRLPATPPRAPRASLVSPTDKALSILTASGGQIHDGSMSTTNLSPHAERAHTVLSRQPSVSHADPIGPQDIHFTSQGPHEDLAKLLESSLIMTGVRAGDTVSKLTDPSSALELSLDSQEADRAANLTRLSSEDLDAAQPSHENSEASAEGATSSGSPEVDGVWPPEFEEPDDDPEAGPDLAPVHAKVEDHGPPSAGSTTWPVPKNGPEVTKSPSPVAEASIAESRWFRQTWEPGMRQLILSTPLATLSPETFEEYLQLIGQLDFFAAERAKFEAAQRALVEKAARDYTAITGESVVVQKLLHEAKSDSPHPWVDDLIGELIKAGTVKLLSEHLNGATGEALVQLIAYAFAIPAGPVGALALVHALLQAARHP